jgi:hypothetical protein
MMRSSFRGLLGDAVREPDWTARMDALRPPSGNIDQDMIAYPPNYPDYWMPGPPAENLNSMEGVEVRGSLPVKLLRALRDLGAGR